MWSSSNGYATLSVTVQNAGGTALTNDTVTLSGGPSTGTLAAANNGTVYNFQVLPGDYTVSATDPSALAGSATITVAPGTPATLTVTVK